MYVDTQTDLLHSALRDHSRNACGTVLVMGRSAGQAVFAPLPSWMKPLMSALHGYGSQNVQVPNI